MIRRPPRSTLTDNTLSLHDALPIYRRAGNRPWCPRCASTRARWSTAGDPELQRSAGSIARLHEDGQSNSAPQAINDGISTWHHLLEVLHFVCELRGVHDFGAAMDPGSSPG